MAGWQGLDEVDGFAIREADNCFFVASGATLVGTALAAEFAIVVRGANLDDLLVEDGLDGLFDFQLVGETVNFENDLVVLLLEKRGLFAEADFFDDLVDVFHGRKFGSFCD